jgi:hypothetical protein
MEPKDYPIIHPGKWVILMPTLVGATCLMILVTVLTIAKAPTQDWLHAWPVLPAVLVLPFISWHMGHRTVRLGDAGLRIRSFPWPRTLALSNIELDKAEIVDLGKRTELQPVFKAAGSRMPGYRAGRFRLRNGRWASVLVTDAKRVLLLPLRDGGLVLLSVERGEALLEAMRRRVGEGAHGRG